MVQRRCPCAINMVGIGRLCANCDVPDDQGEYHHSSTTCLNCSQKEWPMEVDFLKTSTFIAAVASVVAVITVAVMIFTLVGPTSKLVDRIDSTSNVMFQNINHIQRQLDAIQETLNETD